jgi:hypothetical protein
MQSEPHESLLGGGSSGTRIGSEKQLVIRLDQDVGLAEHIPDERPYSSSLKI